MTKLKVKDQWKVFRAFKNQKKNQMSKAYLKIDKKSQLRKEILFKNIQILKDLIHLNLLIKYLEEWKKLDNQKNLENLKYQTH